MTRIIRSFGFLKIPWEKIEKTDLFWDDYKYKLKFEYETVTNVDLLLDYAKNKYEAISDSVRNLESRADSVIRYLFLGTGLVLIYIKDILAECSGLSIITTLLGLLCILISLVFALMVKATYEKGQTPSIKMVFEKDKNNPEAKKFKVSLTLDYLLAFTYVKVITNIKGWRIKWSYRFLALAIITFIIVFCINLVPRLIHLL